MPTFSNLIPLLLVLLLCGVLAIVIAAALMARLILRPPRMSDGKASYLLQRVTPADIGLPFENLNVTIRDSLKNNASTIDITGWWIAAPGGSNRTVVLVHGFADAKVGALAWAPLLLQMGFNVYTPDLRAHGESGGAFQTAGVHERHDLDAAIDIVKSRKPAETQDIILYGVSLGGSVVLAAGAIRQDVSAVIADCPFADFPAAIASHAWLVGAPGWPVPQLAARLAALRIGVASFDEVAPKRSVTKSCCKVLIIAGAADPITPASVRDELAAAIAKAPAGSRMVVMDDIAHLRGLPDATEEYAGILEAFVK